MSILDAMNLFCTAWCCRSDGQYVLFGYKVRMTHPWTARVPEFLGRLQQRRPVSRSSSSLGIRRGCCFFLLPSVQLPAHLLLLFAWCSLTFNLFFFTSFCHTFSFFFLFLQLPAHVHCPCNQSWCCSILNEVTVPIIWMYKESLFICCCCLSGVLWLSTVLFTSSCSWVFFLFWGGYFVT